MANELASLTDLKEWGDFAIKASLLPANVSVAQAMAIIQTGREMGLQPLQSLRSMSFVKGRLVMSVQLQLALAKQKGVSVVDLSETDDKCKVTLKREAELITCEYTLEDAKKAELLTKNVGTKKDDGRVVQPGAWEKYQRQMLRWRAIGDALRLIAPDLVMGLSSPEEAEAESLEPYIVQVESSVTAEKEVEEKEKTRTTTNFEFLKVMKEEKDRLGEEIYYGTLGLYNYAHSNQIIEKEKQINIYKVLKKLSPPQQEEQTQEVTK